MTTYACYRDLNKYAEMVSKMCDAIMQTAGFIGSKSLIIGQSCPFYEVKKKHSNSSGTAEKKTDDWIDQYLPL